jgi:hypothetical protein
MNAHTPNPLTGAAIANAGVLRQIRDAHAGDAVATLEALAALNTDQTKANLKRSLGRLIEDDILALDGEAYHLTEAGARALLALDVAEGLTQAGLRLEHEATRQQRWPIDRLYPNPDNPERPIDDERDANFRESIIAAGDLLQPLAVSPVDATGGRMIWDGHRRWEGCRILAEDQLLPAPLNFGLPFVEVEIDPAIPPSDHRALAVRVALIANEQRADVPPWEDAKLLALYAELTGEPGKPKPARQVALEIGRAHAGSEQGVKDVQRKIKVVREAAIEDIRRHEADPAAFTWEMLRDSVSERRPAIQPGGWGEDAVLSAKNALVLTELAHAAHTRGDIEVDPWVSSNSAEVRSLFGRGLIGESYGDGEAGISVGYSAWEWLTKNDLDPRVNGDALFNARRAAGWSDIRIELLKDGYATPWLNADFVPPPLTAAEPAAPEGPTLTPKQVLCLVEVGDYLSRYGKVHHTRLEAPCLDPYPRGGSYHLVEAGLMGFSHYQGKTDVSLNEGGWREIDRLGQRYDPREDPKERQRRLYNVRREVVSQIRAELAMANDDYITGWLDPVAAGATAAVAHFPTAAEWLEGKRDDADPLLCDGKRFPNETILREYLRRLNGEGGASSPAKARTEDGPAALAEPTPVTAADAMSWWHRLALFELAEKIKVAVTYPRQRIAGGATYAVQVGQYWLSQTFTDLIGADLGMVAHAHSQDTGGRPFAALTAAGEDWLAQIGFDANAGELLAQARAAVGASKPDDSVYVTDWLNVTSPPSEPLAAEGDDGLDPPPRIDEEKYEPATEVLMAEGILPPEEPAGADMAIVDVTARDQLDAMRAAHSDLWAAASIAFDLLNRVQGEGDPVEGDDLFQGTRGLQTALFMSAHHAKASARLRDFQPAHIDAFLSRFLLVLRKGDVVHTGGAQTYRLEGFGARHRPEEVVFNVQPIAKGKNHGGPRQLDLSQVKGVVAVASDGDAA